MYAARQRHQKRALFIVAQKAARLGRWLDTARELQNHPHGQEPCGATRTESTRPVRRERARVGSAPGRGAAGRGQGGGAWLPHPEARCCWMRGRYITYFSLKSEPRIRGAIARGFQIWSQKCRARSVAPAKVCRARQFIRRFNSTNRNRD